MISTSPSSILELSPPDFKPTWNVTYNTLEWPNGCKAVGISADAGGSAGAAARGHSAYCAWIDELAKFSSDAKETFVQVDLAVRGKGSQILVTTTPTPIDIIKFLYKKAIEEKDPLYHLTTGSTFENAANLDENYLKSLKDAYENTAAWEQEINGCIIWASESALFRKEDIEKNRVDVAPELERIVVAVDPAISIGKDSTGIIVAGIDERGHIYILNDLTMQGTPAEWARVATQAYRDYEADVLVAEKNQGGLMVEHTIQSHDRTVPVKLVSATRGKIIRAEPVSLYHQQGKIHMVGHFPVLEQQMVEYDGTQRKSPDAYDAYVWGASELMLGKQHHVSTSEFYL